ncbi:DUF3466 family protein [Methylomonas sp. BW4-1]|uniref:DUF3466 family protein n=1 Tax=Methylomonas sp. BW4-1 TaxID=3376685 RepID=UPI004042AD90
MTNYYLNSSLLVACLLATNAAQADPTFRLTNLGTLGGSASWATAINANGQVTGSAQIADGSYRAFIADPNGTMREVVTPSGFSSYGLDINNAGQITGYLLDTSSKRRAFLTNAHGTLSDLGTYGGNSSVGLGINDAGQVAGQVIHNTGDANAFVDNPPGYYVCCSSFSSGNDINSSGQVAGFDYSRTPYYFSETNYGHFTHAYIFNPNGQQIDLGTLGGTASWASAINDTGQVTGYAYTKTGKAHAFLTAAGGQMVDLGTFIPDIGESEGADINNLGQVVGKASISYTSNYVNGQQLGGYSYHAFTTRDGVMTDLNLLIAEGGAGWELLSADGINDNGQIVGMGMFNGLQRAYLLTPIAAVPVPSAVWFFCSGLSWLVFSFRKNRNFVQSKQD